MNMIALLLIIASLFTPIFGQLDQPQLIGNTLVDPNRHREYVDPSLRYQLEWFVDWTREQVIFNVSVATRGHVILGLSLTRQSDVGADIVIGGVAQNGRPYFGDYNLASNRRPVVDRQQNWKLLGAYERSTHTHLTISRPFDTCDQEDVIINDDTRYILWGYGNADQVVSDVRIMGSYPAYILDPDLTPQSIKDFNAGLPGSTPELGGGVRRWNMHEEFHIPPKDTTYWCDIKKFSLPGKRHIIGQNIRVNPEALPHIHHMILMRCNPPPGVSARDIFEPFVGYPGEECYDFAKPLGILPTPFCTQAKGGFAIGMRPIFVPNHVGAPIGETGPDEYYLLQTHYNNPEGLNNITSILDIDLYYTEMIRPQEGASLSVGQNFPGSPSILVPIGEKSHRIHGHCSSACTRAMLPPEGIRIHTGFLHAHNNAGLIMKLQHFRNGRELRPVIKDENYDKLFQTLRLLRNEVVVLPGDQLVMSCYYDTTRVNESAAGGWSAKQEMCVATINYYNLLPGQFPVCKSDLISPQYTFKYLAGTTNLTWDQSRLQYMATAPPQLAGLTVTDISDTAVNWTPELRAQLRRDHITFPQVTICPDVAKAMADAQKGIPPPPPEFTSFPVQAVPFRESRKCSQGSGQGFYG